MREDDVSLIGLTCPKCGHVRPHDGYAEVLLRKWLEQGKPIKGFCFDCGLDWEASANDRARIARALGVQL
jgi:hypothetical protein